MPDTRSSSSPGSNGNPSFLHRLRRVGQTIGWLLLISGAAFIVMALLCVFPATSTPIRSIFSWMENPPVDLMTYGVPLATVGSLFIAGCQK